MKNAMILTLRLVWIAHALEWVVHKLCRDRRSCYAIVVEIQVHVDPDPRMVLVISVRQSTVN